MKFVNWATLTIIPLHNNFIQYLNINIQLWIMGHYLIQISSCTVLWLWF